MICGNLVRHFLKTILKRNERMILKKIYYSEEKHSQQQRSILSLDYLTTLLDFPKRNASGATGAARQRKTRKDRVTAYRIPENFLRNQICFQAFTQMKSRHSGNMHGQFSKIWMLNFLRSLRQGFFCPCRLVFWA